MIPRLWYLVLMRAFVRLRLQDGTVAELVPGDLIGRLWSAALPLDDARVSEAHAMVSLRGQELHLLALRGRFAVGGKPQTEITLAPGMEVQLARDLSLTVEDVTLPTEVLAVEGEGLPRQVLTGVCSLRFDPRPSLVPRYKADGAAHIWSDGQEWKWRVAEGPAHSIEPGATLHVGEITLRAVLVTLASAARSATRVLGSVQPPLRIRAQFDTVHLLREGEPAVALNGISARLLSELVAFAAPVDWQMLAREVWPDEPHEPLLRRKLDVNLARLRRKLEAAGIRSDLVRADGRGHFELFLYDGDEVEDRT